MDDRTLARRCIVAMLALSSFGSIGCASLGEESRAAAPTTMPAAVPFRSAALQYEVAPSGSSPKLAIVYPHPDGLEGMALAEVIVPANPAAEEGMSKWERWLASSSGALRENLPGIKWHESVREAWAFDLPVGEFDQMLRELSTAGFFQAGSSMNAGEATVAVRRDGNNVAKPWARFRPFDLLIARVREEGRLISHARSPAILAASQPEAQAASPARAHTPTPSRNASMPPQLFGPP